MDLHYRRLLGLRAYQEAHLEELFVVMEQRTLFARRIALVQTQDPS